MQQTWARPGAPRPPGAEATALCCPGGLLSAGHSVQRQRSGRCIRPQQGPGHGETGPRASRMGVCGTASGGTQALGPGRQPCLGTQHTEVAEGRTGWWSDVDRWGQRDGGLPLLAGVPCPGGRAGLSGLVEARQGLGGPAEPRFRGQPRTPLFPRTPGSKSLGISLKTVSSEGLISTFPAFEGRGCRLAYS